jgi:hypothetical protein
MQNVKSTVCKDHPATFPEQSQALWELGLMGMFHHASESGVYATAAKLHKRKFC